ncbi:hypothetical protein ABZ719_09795 [Streptomyces sp. NPDC006743]|uniref:hypothetical protein n=1 Tax=Streptomyces sp. NPDC006743 TaxID=3154480 RepID=UPI003454D3E1
MLRSLRAAGRPAVPAVAALARFTTATAVLGAVLAVVLVLLPPPAAAAGGGQAALRFEAPAAFRMYGADEGARATNSDFAVPVAVPAGVAGPARDVRVVVDTSGLSGVARAVRGGAGNCTGEGPVFTCAYGDVQNGDGESQTPFVLHGVDGVEPGDSGTVTYTATAGNAAPVTGSTRMTVGGPALLSPGTETTVRGVEPGRPVPLTPRFANRSRFTAGRGVALRITARDGLLLTSRPGNCRFDASFTSAWCTFSTKAAPGTAYRTRSPLTFTAAPGKLTGTLSYAWSSDPGGPDGPDGPGRLTVRGTGAPLTLVPTGGRGLTGGTGRVSVETTVQDDYEPVTATVRGRVGETVTVRLGLRDHGPGRPGTPEALGGFEVVPPEGTTVTSVPFTFEDTHGTWACARPDRPGGAFVCDIGSEGFSEVRHEGGTTVIGFRLRIDRRVPGAHGTVRTHNPYDRTPGNDTALVPLDASPALPRPPYRDPLLWGVAGGTVLAAGVAAGCLRRRRRPAPAEGGR